MFGGLGYHVADGVETSAARAARDLVELAAAQHSLAPTVEFRQGTEQHGADGNVDADPQGVSATDHRQQSALGQLFHQPSVTRQHPGVVDPNPAAEQLGQRRPETTGERKPRDSLFQLLRDRGTGLAHHPLTEQGCRLFDGRSLGGVDDVDGRLVGFDDLRDGLVERRQRPAVGERDGTGRPADHGRLTAGAQGQVIGQFRHIPEGRRHDHELRLGEFYQRNLPRPAAFRFGEEVELVHHHLPDIGAAPFPQCQVRQDLGGAADDGGVGVD